MEGLCRKDQVAMTARGPVNPDAAVFIAFFITGVKALFLKRVANVRLAPRSDLLSSAGQAMPRCLSDKGHSPSSLKSGATALRP
jgi:hypothetical protein